MRNYISILIFILLSVCGFSQTNADCINAIPLCTTPNFTFYSTAGNGNVNDIPSGNNISNPSTNPNPPNAGCLLAGENVPQWLLITIGNPGNLEFVFGAGNSSNPQVGFYDWAMWPYSPSACAGIMNNTLPPIRCNWNGSMSGGTGIASSANFSQFGGSASNFEAPLAVSACQQFIICISNYSGVNTLVSFQSLGTASLSCNPNCNPSYMVCAGNAATITPVNFAGLTNSSYSIQPGGTSNTTGSFVVTPNVTTNYTTYITGTNSGNTIQTTTAVSTVTVNPQPSMSPTFTQATCASSVNAVNLGLGFTPSSPVPGYTVTWNPTPASVSSNTQTVASNLQTGQTSVTVTAAGGCSSSISFNMIQVAVPTVTAVNTSGSYSITCATPTINMNAASTYTNGSLNYLWLSTSYTANTQSVGLTQPGSYTLCVTDPATSCSACQTFTIFQNLSIPSNTVNPITQNITCGAASIATFTSTALNPTVNIVHNWYSPQNPGSPASSTNGTTSIYQIAGVLGTHTVEFCNLTNGCCSSQTVFVQSNAGFPSFQTSSTTNYSLGCSPSSMTLCITNVTSAINGPTSYLFLPPNTPSAVPIPTTAFSSNLCTVVSTPGPWTVVVNDVTNQCQTALPVFVLQNTVAPQIAHVTVPGNTHTLTCFNPTLFAVGSSSTPNTVISWQIPSNPPILPSSTLVLGPPTGPNTSTSNTTYANYTVIATNTVNGCVSTETVVVSQNFLIPKPSVSVGNPSRITCKKDPVILTYSGFSGGSGIVGAVATTTPFGWSGPSPQPNLAGSNTYTAFITGIYTLTVQDNKNGCTGFTTTTITDDMVAPALSPPNFTVPLSCGQGTASGTASIQIALSQSITSNQWSVLFKLYNENSNFGPTAAIGSSVITGTGVKSNNVSVSPIITTDTPGQIFYTVFNHLNGCTSTGVVDVIPAGLNADFTANVLTGYAPLTVNFNSNSTTSTGSGSVISLWSFGNGAVSTTTGSIGTSALYNSPGTYTVMMISSQGICSDTSYKTIFVELPSKLEIPNVFTPNGDGSNDLFYLRTANLTEIDVVIFDRWGNKVYEVVSNTGNIAWDGKNLSGNNAPAGTYFYIIKATGKDGKAYEQKGNVSLYR